jgi:hypothetical protein
MLPRLRRLIISINSLEVVPKHSAILSGYASYGIRANHMVSAIFCDKASSAKHLEYDKIPELRR